MKNTALGAQLSQPIAPPILESLEGSFFPECIPSNKPVVGLKPGHSGVVIGYHVDEFTHI